jgi:hypothetical protein
MDGGGPLEFSNEFSWELEVLPLVFKEFNEGFSRG